MEGKLPTRERSQSTTLRGEPEGCCAVCSGHLVWLVCLSVQYGSSLFWQNLDFPLGNCYFPHSVSLWFGASVYRIWGSKDECMTMLSQANIPSFLEQVHTQEIVQDK